MPLVIFEDAALRVEAPEDGALGDVCDDAGAPIPFSCRSANCGTCRVVILEGADVLAPADDEEQQVLDAFGDRPDAVRLACTARFAGAGTLRVRAVRDDE